MRTETEVKTEIECIEVQIKAIQKRIQELVLDGYHKNTIRIKKEEIQRKLHHKEVLVWMLVG